MKYLIVVTIVVIFAWGWFLWPRDHQETLAETPIDMPLGNTADSSHLFVSSDEAMNLHMGRPDSLYFQVGGEPVVIFSVKDGALDIRVQGDMTEAAQTFIDFLVKEFLPGYEIVEKQK